jgi:hypothetical protein
MPTDGHGRSVIAMNHHLTSALAQTYIDDLHRAAATAHRRPHPRRRRHTLRPRNPIGGIARVTRLFMPTP